MSHCLVVGGTGMLRGVVLSLAQRFSAMSVIARTPAHLDALASQASTGVVRPIAVDWNSSVQMRERLAAAIDQLGTISLAVCWIHSTAPDAPLVVAEAVANRSEPCPYFHIFGSPSDANRPIQQRWQESLSSKPGIAYRRIILGSKLEHAVRRSLTDDEICAGVLVAINSGEALTLVNEPGA